MEITNCKYMYLTIELSSKNYGHLELLMFGSKKDLMKEIIKVSRKIINLLKQLYTISHLKPLKAV
jgi:hypothetical protein